MGETVAATLLICTRDRADRLARLLTSIVSLEPTEGLEVVVVDNGSVDDTPALLRCFAADSPFPVTLVHEPVAGLGRARSRGLQAAVGAVVILADDDCLLPPGHARAVLACFDADRSLGWVAGRILAASPSAARVALLESVEPRRWSAGDLVWPGEVQGANLSFRRMALDRAGGFDVRLGAGTEFRCEDVEACGRVLRAGWSGAFAPELAVLHDHRRDAAAARRLERANAKARGAYVELAAGADRRYRRAWLARCVRRCGRRPDHVASGVAVALRELQGALRWRRHATCRP